MSTAIKINTDKRKTLRDINSILGTDLRKYLAELLTNSDDSYSRMENKGLISVKDKHPITIVLERKKRVISVIDNAEGMSEKDIYDKFNKYGADTSGNDEVNSVRGMFGQGATDVLFAAALENLTAKIISVKDSLSSECNFFLNSDKERSMEFSDYPKTVEEIRKKYFIKSNGTIVEFGVPNSVNIPKEKLLFSLVNFYMLRFLFQKENRDVIFIDSDNGKKGHLTYDNKYYDFLDILVQKEFEFEYKGFKIKGKIELKHNPSKEDVDAGILIYDKNGIIYDNQFFGRKNFSGMEQVEGTIELDGAKEVITYFLNTDVPEQIVTDTRDGFDEKHDFYKIMKKKVEPYIIEACTKVMEIKKGGTFSFKNNKEFMDAFKEINNYFKQEIEEISPVGGSNAINEPPAEGLRFVRPKINITNGKKYSLKLLVDTNLIPSGSLIMIDGITNSVEVTPAELVVPMTDENPVMLSISILGNEVTQQTVELKAIHSTYSSKLFVDVVDQNIHYPAYGLEFYPNPMKKKPIIKSKAHLFVDVKKYTIGTQIKIESMQSDIILEKSLYEVLEEELLTDEIAMIDVELSGGLDQVNYKLKAIANAYETELKLVVRETEEQNLNKGGMINDIQPTNTVTFCQTYYDDSVGIVYINKDNEINKNILNSWLESNEFKNKEQKKYLCDICANECAKYIAKKKLDGGKVEAQDFYGYFDVVQKEKNHIYEIFLKAMK